MPSQTYRIQLEGIEKSYPTEDGQLRVLDKISLNVRDGEFLSIVGPSGCGKSTLLNIIVDWIGPDAGTVDITPSRSDVRLGFVFQDSTLLDWRTVRQNLSFALRGLSVPEEEHDRKVDTALDLVGLSEVADQYPPSLSGGMRQRVNFARAFCVGPDVLLMDEPFSSLDELTARGLRERVVDIWRDERFTAVLVTHDISEAAYFSDRILVLSDTPTVIEDVITIDSDRPRDPESKEVIEYERRILEALGVSI
ncbi:ABC transporter ATP-binding protein [Haloplanus salilacus]|uniref:ABC transporter ATP-binding protein n=1 Tax=Haloplanus salilacus TaxID=2949994 RepID=UPI0030CDBB2A